MDDDVVWNESYELDFFINAQVNLLVQSLILFSEHNDIKIP